MLATETRVELKQLTHIAAPLVIAQVAQSALNTVDVIMAGQLSADALAAVSTGVNLFATPMLFILGIFLALNPIISQFNGARDNASMVGTLQSGIWFAVLISIPVFFLWRELDVVMDWLDVEPSIRPLAAEYVDALSWGTPFFWLFLALRFCNEGLFATRAVMTITIVAIPINALLNWVLIYGKFGFPELGAVGLAWATNTVWLMMFVSMLIYTARAKRHRHLHGFLQWCKPDWPRLLDIAKTGVPMGLSFSLEVLMFAMIGLMMATYDAATIGAHQIALNFASLMFMIPLGISNAITARVGYAAGERSPEAVRRAGWTGILFAVSIAMLSTLTMWLLPWQITAIYTPNTAVQTLAVAFLSMAAIFQLSDALQVTAAGALRGLKDTRVPMFISLFSYWIIGFPSAWLLANKTALGPAGYWAGMIAGLSTAALLLNWRFKLLAARWQPSARHIHKASM